MVDDVGRVMVMDFGLAKALTGATEPTAEGTLLGTARYMSPEHCLGQELDPRTDVYSLGVTIFQLLTGQFRSRRIHRWR